VFVKTHKFKKPVYIGDPVNTINLFNKFEVDEIVLLDIGCQRSKKEPNFSLIEDLASECWVPLSYGGGVQSVAHAKKILNSGIEKIVFDSLLHNNPEEVKKCVNEFGASSVVGCIDVKATLFGQYEIRSQAGKAKVKKSITELVLMLRELGVGELIINNISRDGTAEGYDLSLIEMFSSQLDIPVVALGGASALDDFKSAVDHGASAAAAGSYFVFQEGMSSGVLVNYPARKDLEDLFYGR
jgi:cyclase